LSLPSHVGIESFLLIIHVCVQSRPFEFVKYEQTFTQDGLPLLGDSNLTKKESPPDSKLKKNEEDEREHRYGVGRHNHKQS
jgi:hypothetical protein